MLKIKLILISVFSILILFGAYSQDSIVVYSKREFKGDRPKIGLVLSGGGAKGMAHVGALKVLDSLGIKPDYITGTSMGSIIGGLYAIGYSPSQLEAMIKKIDWSHYLSNTNDYTNINMIEKENYDNYFEFPFIGWTPSLPQGAIKGQELELLFNELTITVAGDTNFNEFPIPFRAVAVDILKGKPYVFSSGSLALAMRSSMSIPTIMNPIKYKGMLLVDGGLLENFPVQVCLDMGADIIIGVYTGAELLPEDKLNSMINIMKQSSFIASINNAEESKKKVDIYIEPYLSDRNAANFGDGKINIKRGYEAAELKLPELIKLKTYLSKFPQNNTVLEINTDTLVESGHFIDFSDSDESLKNIIEKNFKHIDNNKLNTKDIENSIHYLYGTRLFKKLTYDFLPSKTDSGVTIRYNVVKERDRQLLLSLQYKTESKMGINIGFRYRNLFIPGSRIELKFRLSENPGAKVNLFSYINSNIRHGIDATYYYRTSKIPFYDNKTLVGEYSNHFHRWSSAYHYFANGFSDFSVGFAHERIYYTRIIDVSEYSFPKIIDLESYVNIAYKRNTKNKKYFTSKGSVFRVNSKLFINNTTTYYLPQDSVLNPDMIEYEIDSNDIALTVMINYKHFKSIGNRFVFSNEIDAFAGLGYVYNVWVGGVNPDIDYQLPFWGMSENSRMEANGWIYRIGLRYNLLGKVYLTGKLNGGFFAEDLLDILSSPEDYYGQYSSMFNYENYAFGGGLELSYQSVLGPIGVSVARSSESSAFWWHLLIGYSF